MELNIVQQEDLRILKEELIKEIKEIVKSNIVNQPKKEWLPEKEAMEVLDVSKSTIQNYRKDGLLPFSQHGKKIMYKYKDLNFFLIKNYINNGE